MKRMGLMGCIGGGKMESWTPRRDFLLVKPTEGVACGGSQM